MSASTYSGAEQRVYWWAMLRKIVTPVFDALARNELKKTMPVECKAGFDRAQFAHLQALACSLHGLGSWLNVGGLTCEEAAAQEELVKLVRTSLANATDPNSPDRVNFTDGQQTIVDSAVLSLGLLRCKKAVWDHLEAGVRANIVGCLAATRKLNPPFNNWLLFAATTEAFLCAAGENWDRMRVDYAIRQHEQWYKGDGMYGDGPFFHFDYYNSFVIQPMLLEILDTVSKVTDEWDAFREPIVKRAQRFAQVLERLVAPDGTFPLIGRLIVGRTSAFHLLAAVALQQRLPAGLPPAQVRCALTAVIRRVLDVSGTFDANGWLKIGLCGSQPSIAENYVSTGILYACTNIFLPLGLPASDPFWTGADEEWTQARVWSGKAVEPDHSITDYDSYILRVR